MIVHAPSMRYQCCDHVHAVLHAVYCVSKRTPTTHARRRRIVRMRHRAAIKASNEGQWLGDFTRVRDFMATRITRLRTERTLRKWNTPALTAHEFAPRCKGYQSVQTDKTHADSYHNLKYPSSFIDNSRQPARNLHENLDQIMDGNIRSCAHVRWRKNRQASRKAISLRTAEGTIRLHRRDGIILRRSGEKLRCREKFIAPYN